MSKDSYYLKHPKDQLFYRILAMMSTFLSLGDQELWGFAAPYPYKLLGFQGLLILTFTPPILLSQFIYLYLNWSTLTMSTLSCIFTIIPISVVDFVYIVSAQYRTYKNLISGFINNIHLHNYENQKINSNKIRVKVEDYTRKTAWFLMILMGMDWGCWVVGPIMNKRTNIDKIINKTAELQSIIHVWMPYDYNHNFRNWIIQHIMNIYLSFLACYIIAVANVINYTYIFNLIGHIEVLKEEIKSYVNGSDDYENRLSLINIIRHHAFINKIFKDVQSAFGLNVTAIYSHNLFADSLVLYNIMTGDKESKAMYMLMFTIFMGGLIQMSFVLEQIRIQSEDLSDYVYSMPWEQMTLSNQKTFILLLNRVQPPLEFISAGGLRAGVKPMISILKSTFSYYVMLKESA